MASRKHGGRASGTMRTGRTKPSERNGNVGRNEARRSARDAARGLVDEQPSDDFSAVVEHMLTLDGDKHDAIIQAPGGLSPDGLEAAVQSVNAWVSSRVLRHVQRTGKLPQGLIVEVRVRATDEPPLDEELAPGWTQP